MTKGGSPLASPIRTSVAQLELGVGWVMFAESNPSTLSSPNKVDGGARVTDQRLGSLELTLLLGSPLSAVDLSIGFSLISCSGFPYPLSWDSAPVSLRMRQPLGTLTPWGLTGTSWAS